MSALIYLDKTEKSIKEDAAFIKKLEHKINQSIRLKKTLESISIPEKKSAEILAAQFIDSLKAKFPEINIEISKMTKEQKQLSLDMSLKAETSWSRFTDLLSFLEETGYPFIFIKSISISQKGNSIGIDIKTELKLIYQEDDKRV
ncbi:hypothetical protein V4D30_06715 [Thermodesulfovibrio sp. 3907-1M]|uniref:Type II secretion system protein M n=1 Tax=Thermodesulfovibrio autotrophicus TaxID=3118333 RepID=A0AAU8GUV0_9BACT